MPNAATKISVPRISPETQAANSPAGNQKPVTSIDRAQKRISARMAVVRDHRVSPGARLLYVLLDDFAGMKGVTWYRQAVSEKDRLAGKKGMAEHMGVSRQTINEWLKELAGVGLIKIDSRRSHCAMYALAWAIATLPPNEGGGVGQSGHESCQEKPTCDVGESRHLEAPHLLSEPEVLEPAPQAPRPCARCADLGWLGYTVHRRDDKETKAVLCGCKTIDEAGGWGRGETLLRRKVLVVRE